MNTDEIKELCREAFLEGIMEAPKSGEWRKAFESWWESKRPKARYFKANHVQGLYAKLQDGASYFVTAGRPEWEHGLDGSILTHGYTEIHASELPPEIKQ